MERKPSKVSPTSLDYEEINELAQMIAIAKNLHIIPGYEGDIPEAERKAIISQLEGVLGELLDFQRLPFNDALKKIGGG